MLNLNSAEYRDKVLGCWTGKNIGGTLGAPFEGKREINAVEFYTQDLAGKPVPNDDLDLQLVWLAAIEENGLYRITPRLLGEYWFYHIIGPWNEYSVCKNNIANGLLPPLSGSCNNERWKSSNGAWIRSEIWACLFPGCPDEAIHFAYMDSCADHYGEGIYAEMFTAALESAAFVVSDVRELIRIGLAKIPADSRVAQTVKLVCDQYDQGVDWLTVREAVVQANADLGWFQAPGNLGFVVLGLLYGEGDFGKSICRATNCGDDTDCTAATVGSILGIIKGRSGIPKNWIEPIGESIQTVAINVMDLQVPPTLQALTDRVIRLARIATCENPNLPRISENATAIPEEDLQQLTNSKEAAKIWAYSPYELIFDLPFGELAINYEGGPEVVPGEPKKLIFRLQNGRYVEGLVSWQWLLPEDWQVLPAAGGEIFGRGKSSAKLEQTIIPGKFSGSFFYMPLEIRISGRNSPVMIYVPLQQAGTVKYLLEPLSDDSQRYWERLFARRR